MSLPGGPPRSSPGPSTASGTAFSSQFHAPSFGDDDDFSFAMSTEPQQQQPQPKREQQHHQQQQEQHQESPQAQYQQEHMYSQLAHPPLQHSMMELASGPMVGGMPLGSGGSGPDTLDALAPKFPPQTFEVPDISLSNSVTSASGFLPHHAGASVMSSMDGAGGGPPQAFYSVSGLSQSVMTSSMPVSRHHLLQGVPAHFQRQPILSTLGNQLAASQMPFQALRPSALPGAASSSHNSSPGRGEQSSEDSDDCLPLAKLVSLKRSAPDTVSMDTGDVHMMHSRMEETGGHPPAPMVPPPAHRSTPPPATPPTTNIAASPAKKAKVGAGAGGGKKGKKKKDPNEPQKPVSAYALFFRDTQAAIKGQNPSASFGEVSKIVASMWDGLDPTQKDIYKKRTELAKKEYLKQLAAYRASQVSQSASEEAMAAPREKSPSPPSIQSVTISPAPNQGSNKITIVQLPQQQQQQHYLQQQQQIQQQQIQQHMQQQQMQQQQMQQQQQQHQMQQQQQMQEQQQMQIQQEQMQIQQQEHYQSAAQPPTHIFIKISGKQSQVITHPLIPQQQQQQLPPQHQHQTLQQTQSLADAKPSFTVVANASGYVASEVENRPPMMDPFLSAAHDSGLFARTESHESPANLNMLCVRNGCQNLAVENPGWDAEYCSNECVVSHCRDIFTAWVAARGGQSSFPVK